MYTCDIYDTRRRKTADGVIEIPSPIVLSFGDGLPPLPIERAINTLSPTLKRTTFDREHQEEEAEAERLRLKQAEAARRRQNQPRDPQGPIDWRGIAKRLAQPSKEEGVVSTDNVLTSADSVQVDGSGFDDAEESTLETGTRVQVRVQLIRQFKTCTTDIYLHNDCAHVELSVHAPVSCQLRADGRNCELCQRQYQKPVSVR